jgi:hypothetical protein
MDDLEISIFFDDKSNTYVVSTNTGDVYTDFATVDDLIDFCANDLGIDLDQDLVDELYNQERNRDDYEYEDDGYELVDPDEVYDDQ